MLSSLNCTLLSRCPCINRTLQSKSRSTLALFSSDAEHPSDGTNRDLTLILQQFCCFFRFCFSGIFYELQVLLAQQNAVLVLTSTPQYNPKKYSSSELDSITNGVLPVLPLTAAKPCHKPTNTALSRLLRWSVSELELLRNNVRIQFLILSR